MSNVLTATFLFRRTTHKGWVVRRVRGCLSSVARSLLYVSIGTMDFPLLLNDVDISASVENDSTIRIRMAFGSLWSDEAVSKLSDFISKTAKNLVSISLTATPNHERMEICPETPSTDPTDPRLATSAIC